VGGGRGGRRMHAFRSLAGNRALVRVLGGYALFILTECAVWIAMLVFAYGHGGATIAGLVALVQLVPAAVLAPIGAAIAERRSPVVLLVRGYLVQAAGMAATAAAIFVGVPVAAYAFAAVTSVALTTTRPAQSALIPSVAATPDQLTAANVVVSWLEAAGLMVSGLLVGVVISVAGVASVFAVCAGLGVVAALLVAGFQGPTLASPHEASPSAAGGVGEGLRLAFRRPRLRLMLALLTAEAVVAGALDLLFVILAIGVLGRSQAWAGYLNSTYGVGAVLAATVSAMLIGRRLGAPILGAALLLSGVLAVLGLGLGLAGTVALLVAAGAASTLLDVALRILLQRSVPPQLMVRVFGVLEGLTMAGYAAGALLVPLLVHLGGNRLALLGVATVLPLTAAVGGWALFALDAEVPVPVVEIALLRSLPLFAELPAPAIEGLAAALTPVHLPPDTVLIRQGDPGDAYYAIAAGELDALKDGHFVGRFGRGEGVGEIALLRAIPRTATVIAHTAATVYQLNRELFLTSVLGHAATHRMAERIADTRLAIGTTPGIGDSSRASAAEPGQSAPEPGPAPAGPGIAQLDRADEAELALTVWSVNTRNGSLLRPQSNAPDWSRRYGRSGKAGCSQARRTWTQPCSSGSGGASLATDGCAWRTASSYWSRVTSGPRPSGRGACCWSGATTARCARSRTPAATAGTSCCPVARPHGTG
jgi:cyclic nucleotide-binding protein/MFS transporter